MRLRCQNMTPGGHAMFREHLNLLQSQGKRYFTFDQILQDLKISADSAKSGLYRMKKKGMIITPAKGLYVIVPPEHRLLGSIPAEELAPILMQYLQADHYVSLLSGACFYGATHQKPASFQIVTNKRIKHHLEFGYVKLELFYKKNTKDLPYKNFMVDTGYLKVATPELVAIDLLTYLNRSGGLSHVATVLSELIESIDGDKLILLAKQIGEKYQLQRLGYILEKIDTVAEDKKKSIVTKLENYLNNKLKYYLPLVPEISGTGHPREKKWKIIENTNIESDL